MNRRHLLFKHLPALAHAAALGGLPARRARAEPVTAKTMFRLLVQPPVVPLAQVGRAGLAPATLDELLAHARNPADPPMS